MDAEEAPRPLCLRREQPPARRPPQALRDGNSLEGKLQSLPPPTPPRERLPAKPSGRSKPQRHKTVPQSLREASLILDRVTKVSLVMLRSHQCLGFVLILWIIDHITHEKNL